MQKLLRPGEGGVYTKCARAAWAVGARYLLIDACAFNAQPQFTVRSGLFKGERPIVYEIMDEETNGTPDVRELYLLTRQQLKMCQTTHEEQVKDGNSVVASSSNEENFTNAPTSAPSHAHPQEFTPIFDSLAVKYHTKLTCILRHLLLLNQNSPEMPAFLYHAYTGGYEIRGRMCKGSNLADTIHLLFSPFAVDECAFSQQCMRFIELLAFSSCPSHVVVSPGARTIMQRARVGTG